MTDRIRQATLGDVPAIRAILAAHGNDGPVVGGIDIVGPYIRHCIGTGIALVTERDEEIVAYGATLATGVGRHLADLFVRPDLVGAGLGRPLLSAAFGDAPDRTVFASEDPRALPLYVRAGMTPFWPSLYMDGPSSALAAAAQGLAIEPAGPDRLAALERAWTGAERAADHRFWASQAGAEGFVVLDAGQPAAFAYARARQMGTMRAIDRLVVHPQADPIGPILDAIRYGGRGGLVRVAVPGPNPVLPALLAAGFRIVDRDQFMATDAAMVDPTRLLPNGGML